MGWGDDYGVPKTWPKGSVPYNDQERRRQWVRRGGQVAVDRSGAPCEDSLSCKCPTCKEFAKMRERAHGNHYLRNMAWPEAWRAAGWDGGAETPFMNPGDKLSPAEAAAEPSSPRNGNWMADRFAGLFDVDPAPEMVEKKA